MKISNPFSQSTTQTNLSTKIDLQIENLVPGQILQGEVVSKNGNDITLKLAKDMVLTARLERELNLELGKLLTFQVKNNGKVLSLSPLFENMSMDKTIYKALDMANIPISERNVEMATSMMERGMSVDVNSIQNVYKDVATFTDATVEHILTLHQMDIPVTAENLQQLNSYENFKHQLALGMEQVAMDLQAEGIDQPLLGMVLETVNGDSGMSVPLNQALTSQELLALADSIRQMEPNLEHDWEVVNFMENPIHSDMTVKDILKFLSQMKPDDAGEEQEFNILLSGEKLSFVLEGLKEFFGSETFGKLLSKQFQSEWTLLPNQFADKEYVREFYEQITRQLEGLKKVLLDKKGEDSTALKSVNNLRSNILFVNQLNQLYAYIQIPLNIDGSTTHGELYVYSNKKNLARFDGTVSALLHLDMEHLGPVDVYVAMQNQNVTTNFYLETDELLDFIQAHISILDEHLTKRGYSLNCKMMQREDSERGFNVIEEIAKENTGKVILSQYAFDVRA